MKKKCLFLISILFISTGALADTYYVSSPRVSNDNSALATTVEQLITSEIISNGQSVTSNPSNTNWTINSSILNLGESYIINISKSNGQKTVFADKLKASSLSNLDVVIQRLVRASIKNISVSQTQTVDSVTEDEKKGNIKVNVQRQYYLGFGPAEINNLGGEDTSGLAFLFGYYWGLDSHLGLRVNLEGASVTDSSATMVSFGIGAQYYINKRRNAPYVLGLMNYSWAGSAEFGEIDPNCSILCGEVETDNGFGGTVGLGYHFFRTSSVNFSTELSYTRGFYKDFDKDPDMFSLKAIILF